MGKKRQGGKSSKSKSRCKSPGCKKLSVYGMDLCRFHICRCEVNDGNTSGCCRIHDKKGELIDG